MEEREVPGDGLQLVTRVWTLGTLARVLDHLPELVHEVPRHMIAAVLLV